MSWWIYLLISITAIFIISIFLYRFIFKRIYDILLSVIAIIILSPLFICLTIIGLIVMKGKPFFIQARPGKNQKIFNLIKFKTMNDAKDKDGNLLPDEKRLSKYGKFLRAASLDELPELFNIVLGKMSFVGPRPLLVKYLSRYNNTQQHRHDVKPGLTGYAQIHGRNQLSWEKKFELDVWYTKNFNIFLDIKILFLTVFYVLKRSGINSKTSATMEEFIGEEAK